MPAPDQGGEGAEVLDAPVRAGTQEYIIDGVAQQRLSRCQSHVVHGLPGRVGGDDAVYRHTHAGVGPVGDHRSNVGGIEDQFAVEDGVLAAAQGLPVGDGLVPVCALGGVLAALEVGEGRFVGGDESAARTHLDGEVAQRQPAFHRQRTNRRSAVFDKIARRTAGADPAHQVQGDILGGDTRPQGSFDADAHRFGLLLEDALRGQHHLHFAGADAESDGTHGPVGGSVRIAADDGHARQGQSLFRSHDVDDAVVRTHHPVMGQPELGGIARQRVHLGLGNGIFDYLVLVMRRGVVVRHTEDPFRAQAADTACAQPVEGLRTGHLVAVQPVDVQLGRAVLDQRDDVRIPYFVEQGIHQCLNLLMQSI